MPIEIGSPAKMNPIQRVTQTAEWQAFQQRDPDLAAETLGVMKARLARAMVSANAGEIPSVMPSAAPTTSAPSIVGGPATSKSRKPLNATEKQTLDSIKNIKGQLIDLRARMQTYGQQKWDQENTPERWKDYLSRKYLATSKEPYKPGQEGDDRDKLMSALINVEANAKAALAHSAGTRAYSYVQDSAGHIPRAPGDFKFNMDNIDYLLSENGPYNGFIRGVGLDPHAGEPTVGAAKMPEAPPTPSSVEDASKKYGGM